MIIKYIIIVINVTNPSDEIINLTLVSRSVLCKWQKGVEDNN